MLIVDDDRDIRETLRDLLSEEGYAPMVAANGVEALAVLQNRRPCLIIVDLMMPVMNGWELLAAISRDDELSCIPKVVITAGPERVTGRMPGIPVLLKPVNLGRLFSLIEQAAHGNRVEFQPSVVGSA